MSIIGSLQSIQGLDDGGTAEGGAFDSQMELADAFQRAEISEGFFVHRTPTLHGHLKRGNHLANGGNFHADDAIGE